MSLDPKFVLLPSLQEVIFDKTLQTFLSSGIVSFFEDENRTVPKPVYTITGTGPGSYQYVSLGSVLTLSGIGSFVDSSGGNIIPYLYPYEGLPTDPEPSDVVELYYITIYSSTGVFQFDISAWPNLTVNASPINNSDTTDNILSNPEFSEVLFGNSATSLNPYTFSTTGTNTETVIAPNWSIITTGNGSVSVYQVIVIDSTAPGNPAYALGITSTGYTSPIQVRQRLLTPRILAGTYASGTFIAEATDGGSYTLSMTYTPSITGTIQTICSGTTLASGFGVIANSTPVLITNPGTGSGYVDIAIVIPVNAPVQISCIQLSGVADNTEVVSYLQQTTEREADHLFNYWQPQLNYKPIPSLLTAWDFPLNPRQFGDTATITTTPAYIFDQTIACCNTGTVSVVSSGTLNDLSITIGSANQSFYLLQYLSADESYLMIQSRLAAFINAFGTTGGVSIKCKVYLFYTTTGGSIPTLPTSIGTIAADGTFTLTAANWTSIPLTNGYIDNFILPIGSYSNQSLPGFNGLSLFNTSSNSNFAIVVTFSIPSPSSMILNSIALMQGDIGTVPSSQTSDEVLRECQYYYETSYSSLADFTANPANNILFISQASENFTTAITQCYASPFSIPFSVIKRTNPNMTYYSVAKTAANVSSLMYYDSGGTFTALGPTDLAVATYWNVLVKTNNFYFTPKLITPLQAVNSVGIGKYNSAGIQFHYVADARLGIV